MTPTFTARIDFDTGHIPRHEELAMFSAAHSLRLGFSSLVLLHQHADIIELSWPTTVTSQARQGERGGFLLDPDSMLDGAYVGGPAKQWFSSCSVITWPGDFPDDEGTSDHRPIKLTLDPTMTKSDVRTGLRD